jgi:hypothetical protein
MRTKLLFAIALFAAQANAQAPLISDRPAKTLSAFTLQKKTFQFESGITGTRYLWDSRDYSQEIINERASFFTRYGLLQWLELEGGIDFKRDIINIGNERNLTSGLGSVDLGFKTIILQGKGIIPQIAFRAVFMQNFEDGLELGPMNADLTLAFSNHLTPYLVLGYQAGTYIAPHNNRTYYYSALLNGRLFDRINMYGEVYKEIEYNGLWLNTGLQFKASNNLQFDLSGGKLTSGKSIWSVGAGFTLRL